MSIKWNKMQDGSVRKQIGGEHKREINRLSISVRDLEKSGAFMDLLCSLEGKIDPASKDTASESLLISAIVCYGRPFSRNEIDKAANADARVTGEVPFSAK